MAHQYSKAFWFEILPTGLGPKPVIPNRNSLVDLTENLPDAKSLSPRSISGSFEWQNSANFQAVKALDMTTITVPKSITILEFIVACCFFVTCAEMLLS